MAAPIGNEFWKQRSSHGRKPIFPDPDDLWSAAEEYFQWVYNNPLQEERVFHHQGEITRTTISKMQAMTLSGLCIFLGISQEGFASYRSKDGFSGVTREIDEIIRTQKFTGAAADLLNANIIARDLGLADSKVITAKIEYTPVEGMSRSQIEEELKDLE